MDLQFSFDFVSDPNKSNDLLNEAFTESFNEESDERLKSLSTDLCSSGKYSEKSKLYEHGNISRKSSIDVNQWQKYRIAKEPVPEETLTEVFEPTSERKSHLYFECQNRVKFDNCSLKSKKFSLSKRSSEIETPFSPLEDISNKKLRRSTSNYFGLASSCNVFESTSKYDEIRISRNPKGDCRAMPVSSKIKRTKVEDLVFRENIGTKPVDKVPKCTSTKNAVYSRKQIPVLNRKTGTKLPSLKSQESDLRNKLQSPGTASETCANKARFGFEYFTPDSKDECFTKRRSLQHENKLREDRLLAVKKHRKSISSLLRKDSNCKSENNIPGVEISGGPVLPNLQSSSPACTIAHPAKEISVKTCADIMSVSQNEKIDALAKEPGILEVTDLTLCTNTVYFSRTFDHTFQSPKKCRTQN